MGLSYCRYIEIFKSSRNEIRAYYELPRRGMGGQRPGPYDRPMMGGPRGGFFGPGPGRGGALMDTMRSGGGYGGGKQSFVFLHTGIFGTDQLHFCSHQRQQNKTMTIVPNLWSVLVVYRTLSSKAMLTRTIKHVVIMLNEQKWAQNHLKLRYRQDENVNFQPHLNSRLNYLPETLTG